MTRKTAKDFHPEVLKLFDKYVHGAMARRDFLKSAGNTRSSPALRRKVCSPP